MLWMDVTFTLKENQQESVSIHSDTQIDWNAQSKTKMEFRANTESKWYKKLNMDYLQWKECPLHNLTT